VDNSRVLIVDDSRAVRAAVAKVIRSSFDICEAADGEAGWAAIERDPGIAVVISEAVRIQTNLGVAALGNDSVASVEELLEVALGRLDRAAAKGEAQRTGPQESIGTTPPGRAPDPVAAALQILERAPSVRRKYWSAAPDHQSELRRVGIDLQEYLFLLQSR
jgi:CheY-like chemotaxis protein